MVVRIVKKEYYGGILAGYPGLKAPSIRGTMGLGISLKYIWGGTRLREWNEGVPVRLELEEGRNDKLQEKVELGDKCFS